MAKNLIPADRLDELDRQLLGLPRRSVERRQIIHGRAAFYGVSETSLYRALRQHLRPKAVRRSDHSSPRVLPRETMERYCELIAAVKIRTQNCPVEVPSDKTQTCASRGCVWVDQPKP